VHGDRLVTIDMGRKWGGTAVPLSVGGAGSQSNTMWPYPRPTSVPSGILIHPTVQPQYTNVYRQIGQDNGPIALGEPFYKRLPQNYNTAPAKSLS